MERRNFDRSLGSTRVERLCLLLALPFTVSACRTQGAIGRFTTADSEIELLRMQQPAGGAADRSISTSHGWRFTLSGPDDPNQPQSWLGPLRIEDMHSGRSCDFNVSLVTSLYGALERQTVIVVSISGSITSIESVSIADCRPLGPKLSSATEGVKTDGRSLYVQPGCDCDEAHAACECSSGYVLQLSKDGQMVVDTIASAQLTKGILGVSFQGTHRVAYPKTPQAHLLEH